MLKKSRRLIFTLGGLLLAIFLCFHLVHHPQATLPEGYTSSLYATFFSLLPPIVAIVLTLITKEVYSSLFIGILTGSLLFAGGSVAPAVDTMLYHESGGLIAGLTDSSHASILVFVTLLGTLVVLMNQSGGAAAFGSWASRHIKSRRGAQLATILMGLLIFVDDGFNCMTVGSVMRPLTDRFNISRAKLAYLLDSTAAPVCIIAPISCWAAAVSYAVPEGLDINGFQMFIHTIPYNLYALGTLFMLLMLSLFRFDFGPMKRHEANALKGDLFSEGDHPYDEGLPHENQPNGKISNLVIPVVTLIISCILGMVYTGGLFQGESLVNAFANADSAKGLVIGSLVTLLITVFLYLSRGIMTLKDFMACLPAGFRSMCAPMIILILSWNLSGVTNLLGAPAFIQALMASHAESLQMLVPAIVFAVSVFLAFSTGTSWGTFTILIPIVCVVFPTSSEMLAISIAACLAGAVCGDHCSPISDTTIMSSAGAASNHLSHVTTQLPYALTCAGCCFFGYLIAGIIGYYTDSFWAVVSTPFTFLLIFAVLFILRKLTSQKADA